MNKKLDTTTVSNYFYTVNNLGQRTNVETNGTVFVGSPTWAWGYNAKGEIVKADSTNNAFDRGYQYDGIGNRISGGDHGSPIAYTANALNQYSAIGSINPAYDLDGNATDYPLPANLSENSTLVWDAENRLISATVSGVTTNYRYDSQSRRIAIWRSDLQSLSSTLYDAWNPIAEYTGSVGVPPTLTKTYAWGLDLSGSMQGAGGVGGLLLITDHSALATSYFPTFDGNGNVSEYLDANGVFAAHYEYDPFGKTTVTTGAKANDFAHRFSTKPLDLTTGLYYYGYRFYDPATGRWPSRDPIEEMGGLNLYGFMGNRGLNGIDYLGLKDCRDIADDEYHECIQNVNTAVTVVAVQGVVIGGLISASGVGAPVGIGYALFGAAKGGFIRLAGTKNCKRAWDEAKRRCKELACLQPNITSV